ncbi:MAG: nitroreductase family deazaflavin-dependent oxidoreductase [Deltaproteobacteria bacterium]|nr:nitroreductase family deazaflavin-dependent oxidoreductase [Deltaproteobacteria bacterium]
MRYAALLSFSLFLSLFALGCGPIGPFPGGSLSGEVATSLPDDWSFSDEVENVQLETRPSEPYSVNVWGVGIGDRFYLASGRGGEAGWVRHIAEDPNVRLRVGGAIYELRAVRVSVDTDGDRFLEALKRKYDWEPSARERDRAWLFRLEPR